MCDFKNFINGYVWGNEEIPLEEVKESETLDDLIETNNPEDIEKVEEIIDVSSQEKEWGYNGKVVLIDCGHSVATPGKRSPKKVNGERFFEYLSNREIGKMVANKLEKLGIIYHFVLDLDEVEDKSLTGRANTANQYCAKYGTANCIFISIHSNAIGNGEEWRDNARGWSIYTTKGKTNSDKYATIFFEEAEKLLPKYGMTLRKDMSDGDPDYEENFTVIYKTWCPAVLIEELFYTSRIDLEFLESKIGKDVLSDIIVNALKRICSTISD